MALSLTLTTKTSSGETACVSLNDPPESVPMLFVPQPTTMVPSAGMPFPWALVIAPPKSPGRGNVRADRTVGSKKAF
jgi:hypothetical protein